MKRFHRLLSAISLASVLLSLPEILAGEHRRSTLPLEKRVIKTTAYTHTEADHIKYRRKNAIGTTLRYGQVRSAAADWSRYPLGTKFRIVGNSEIYVIDDYGSALVGKEVIDLYKPTLKAMNAWGARRVQLEILEWGDFAKSLHILRPRAKVAKHVHAMVVSLEKKLAGS